MDGDITFTKSSLATQANISLEEEVLLFFFMSLKVDMQIGSGCQVCNSGGFVSRVKTSQPLPAHQLLPVVPQYRQEPHLLSPQLGQRHSESSTVTVEPVITSTSPFIQTV